MVGLRKSNVGVAWGGGKGVTVRYVGKDVRYWFGGMSLHGRKRGQDAPTNLETRGRPEKEAFRCSKRESM